MPIPRPRLSFCFAFDGLCVVGAITVGGGGAIAVGVAITDTGVDTVTDAATPALARAVDSAPPGCDSEDDTVEAAVDDEAAT